jgi:hypothetical protein
MPSARRAFHSPPPGMAAAGSLIITYPRARSPAPPPPTCVSLISRGGSGGGRGRGRRNEEGPSLGAGDAAEIMDPAATRVTPRCRRPAIADLPPPPPPPPHPLRLLSDLPRRGPRPPPLFLPAFPPPPSRLIPRQKPKCGRLTELPADAGRERERRGSRRHSRTRRRVFNDNSPLSPASTCCPHRTRADRVYPAVN